jgi:excisionase family DNA binding protein
MSISLVLRQNPPTDVRPGPDNVPMSISQVGKRLGSHRDTVAGMLDRGELPYVKVGKRRRVSHEAHNAFLRGEI